MPETSTSAAPVPAAQREALHVVLFGVPNAGKSSLLGALVQAVETQPDALHWSLPEIPTGLSELRDRLYQDRPRRTTEVIVPYAVTFGPPPAHGRASKGPRLPVVFIDCDGGVAVKLLSRQGTLDGDPAENRLAGEILQADALVLVVAAADPPPADEDFAQFEQFLILLEQHRGRRSDISGLPVFLVLTKCDRLVAPDEKITFADWVDRIEERKREMHRRFEQFRNRRDAAGPSPFGAVELHLSATAVRRPNLTSAAADPQQPFGVAELFRQSLGRARDFRRRSHHANRRLVATILATAAVVLLMAALAVFFLLHQREEQKRIDREAVRAAVVEEEKRYEQWAQHGTTLLSFVDYKLEEDAPVPWRDWQHRVEKLLTDADAEHVPDEHVPGSSSATYATVLASSPVIKARDKWEDARAKLEQQRHLVAALGLTQSQPRLPPLLKISPPPDFTVEQAGSLLDELQKTYPDFRTWSLHGLPPRVARDVRAALDVTAENLLDAGRDEVLRQLQQRRLDGIERPELWRDVRNWLVNPPELDAWRRLVVPVLRLRDPKAEDPVNVLYNFLKVPQFDIELQQLVLSIPEARKLRPSGKLTVYHGTGAEVRATLGFKTLGEGQRDPNGPALLYTFIPDAGETAYRFTYQPGDMLWADLPMKDADGQDRMLTWSGSHSLVYQFERLVRPPRLRNPSEEGAPGELAEDVALSVRKGTVPKVPELMPVVKLAKR